MESKCELWEGNFHIRPTPFVVASLLPLSSHFSVIPSSSSIDEKDEPREENLPISSGFEQCQPGQAMS